MMPSPKGPFQGLGIPTQELYLSAAGPGPGALQLQPLQLVLVGQVPETLLHAEVYVFVTYFLLLSFRTFSHP